MPTCPKSIGVATETPFSARRVQAPDYSVQVTLPASVLLTHGATRGDQIPADYHPDDAVLELFTDDRRMDIDLVSVGSSVGITIPAAIRDRHDISHGDSIFMEHVDGSLNLSF